MDELLDRLTEIRESAVVPEDALEPALQGVVEAAGACAGAICLYDVRQCILRLTAEVGLSDEGCQQLRTVRRADPACWDIPLHGLLNRRAYLIESASRNRYVPKLVDPKTPVTTVICIPLFAGMAPLGSIILVAASPRVFTQRDIERLWTPLRALTAIIEEIRRRVTVTAPSGDLPSIDRAHIERSALAAERDQLLSELAARRAEGEKLAAALEEQIGAAARLRSELEAARVECRRLEREAGQALDLTGTDEAVRARVAQIEHERDELSTSLAAAQTQLREARDEARRQGDEAAARDRSGDEARRALEADVARLTERARGLEQELAAAASGSDATEALKARIEDLETRLAAASREATDTRAALDAGADAMSRFETEAAALRTRCDDVTAQLAARDGEVAQTREEYERARRSEEALATEITTLRATIETLTSERDVAAARASALGDAEASLAVERERAAELERLLAEARDTTGAVAATVESETAALREENARLRETCENLQRECSDLAAAHSAAVERLEAGAPPSGTVTLGVTSMFASDLEATPDDAVTVISVPAEPLTPVIERGSTPLLVVIDSDQSWRSIEIDGYEVYVAAPDTDAAAAVAALDPAHIVANLASGVMNTLGALRKAGSTARFWGCIADPTSGRAVTLGMIEPVIPPVDPETIIAKLGPFANRGNRLITVGTDVDALMSLRQALARRQVSVSMAWDAKQGMDLLHQARPDAMVIDLDLPKGDGYSLVLRGVAQLDPPPYTLLVGGRSGSGKAFSDALAALGPDRHVTGIAEVLTAVCTRNATSSVPDEPRRPKRLPYGSRGRK